MSDQINEAEAVNKAAGTYDDVDAVLDTERKPDVVAFHVKKTITYVVDLVTGELKAEDALDGVLDAVCLYAEGEIVAEWNEDDTLADDPDDIAAILKAAPIAGIMLPDEGELDEDGELRLFYPRP